MDQSTRVQNVRSLSLHQSEQNICSGIKFTFSTESEQIICSETKCLFGNKIFFQKQIFCSVPVPINVGEQHFHIRDDNNVTRSEDVGVFVKRGTDVAEITLSWR